jgi:hypothetical protein
VQVTNRSPSNRRIASHVLGFSSPDPSTLTCKAGIGQRLRSVGTAAVLKAVENVNETISNDLAGTWTR